MSNGFVYLATNGRYHKIGKALDPEKRVQEQRSPFVILSGNRRLRLLHYFPCANYTHAERWLHHHFREKRVFRSFEWYTLAPSDVSWIYNIKYGDSESFPNLGLPDYNVPLKISLPSLLEERLENYIAFQNHHYPPYNPRLRQNQLVTRNQIITQALKEFLERHSNPDGTPQEDV